VFTGRRPEKRRRFLVHLHILGFIGLYHHPAAV
jgi:hypothetical protein